MEKRRRKRGELKKIKGLVRIAQQQGRRQMRYESWTLSRRCKRGLLPRQSFHSIPTTMFVSFTRVRPRKFRLLHIKAPPPFNPPPPPPITLPRSGQFVLVNLLIRYPNASLSATRFFDRSSIFFSFFFFSSSIYQNTRRFEKSKNPKKRYESRLYEKIEVLRFKISLQQVTN